MLVNASGAVVERYVYEPYGKVTFYQANWQKTQIGSGEFREFRGQDTYLPSARGLEPGHSGQPPFRRSHCSCLPTLCGPHHVYARHDTPGGWAGQILFSAGGKPPNGGVR